MMSCRTDIFNFQFSTKNPNHNSNIFSTAAHNNCNHYAMCSCAATRSKNSRNFNHCKVAR